MAEIYLLDLEHDVEYLRCRIGALAKERQMIKFMTDPANKELFEQNCQDLSEDIWLSIELMKCRIELYKEQRRQEEKKKHWWQFWK